MYNLNPNATLFTMFNILKRNCCSN